VLPILSAPVQKNYDIVLRSRLLQDFGDLPLRELTTRKLQQYFGTLEGGHDTLVQTRDVLASVLNAAVEFGLLTKSPLTGVRLPPKKKGKRTKPTIKYHEFERLVSALPEPFATMVFVCVLAALRVTELIGLRWDDIGPDFIMVDERYCRGDWSEPKTEASCAPVAVDPRVIERIRSLKDKSVTINWGRGGAKKTIQLVRADGARDLVFQSLKTGGPMSDHNILTRYLKPIAKEAGLGLVNWQVLRRSYSKWMVAAKADPKSAQAQMRHASLGPTLGIYAQVVTEAQRASVTTLMADMDRKASQPATTNPVPTESQLEHFGT
jgi:integrase